MDDFDDLQRFLSLKRHEKPSDEFLADFMYDFHQAQRAEMLKRSVWRIALDRLETMWPAMPAGRYTYAGSCALALMAAGVTSARILTAPVSLAVADAGKTDSVAAVRGAALPKMDFYASRPATGLAELNFNRPVESEASSVGRPRYVLDSQPVRYEQPFSF